MFEDMKQQMTRVESDLNKSKQAREKQAKEFSKQMDDEKSRHDREVIYIYFPTEFISFTVLAYLPKSSIIKHWNVTQFTFQKLP